MRWPDLGFSGLGSKPLERMVDKSWHADRRCQLSRNFKIQEFSSYIKFEKSK